MLYCMIPCYTILHSILLCYIAFALCYFIICNNELGYIVLYDIKCYDDIDISYLIELYHIVLCFIMLYYTVFHYYDILQCCTIPCCIMTYYII